MHGIPKNSKFETLHSLFVCTHLQLPTLISDQQQDFCEAPRQICSRILDLQPFHGISDLVTHVANCGRLSGAFQEWGQN